MEIIELSSDGEDIIELCSDGDDSTDLCSDSEDDLDYYDDPSNRYHQPLFSRRTTSVQNSMKQPTMLHVGYSLSSAQASSFYRRVENRPATKMMTKSKVKDLPPLMPSRTSVIDIGVDTCLENIESSLFGCDERAVYEEALQIIGQERGEEDLPEGVMSVSLLKHQKIALAWMISKENSSHCQGGILADDQGLGKTISTIALIQKERLQQSRFMTDDSDLTESVGNDDEAVVVMHKKELKAHASRSRAAAARMARTVKAQPKKTSVSSTASTLWSTSRLAAGTLVVCPASVLKQWANELSAKVTESAKLSVLVYHGGSRTRDPSELADYDVVVTTYTIVAREVPKENTDEEQNSDKMFGTCPEMSVGNKMKLSKNIGKVKKKKKTNNSDGGPLGMVRWFRVVLDEAHTIKTYQTQMAKACCGLSAKRRWCLSGTPIQNSIEDLYSYFRFLKYEPYSKFSTFCSMIKNQVSRDAVHGYKKLQAILRIVLLRRTKEMLLDGEPIIKLPPKTIQLSKIDFTQEERAFYLTLEERSRQSFKKLSTKKNLRTHYVHILALLARLRQACDHPSLLKGQHWIDRSIEMAKQLPKETVTSLLENLERGAARCTICCKPPVEPVVAICGHIFCYHCAHESPKSDESVLTDENVLSSDEKILPDDNVLTSDDDNILTSDDDNVLTSDDENVLTSDDENALTSDDENAGKKDCPAPHCGKEISAETVFPSEVLKFLIWPKLESEGTTSCSTAVEKPSSIRERGYISSKIRAAIDILNSIINTRALSGDDTIGSTASEIAPAKAIVFTQWTSMLDLLERSLSSNHIEFRRLDGTMPLNVRERAVKEFNTDPEVRVMIMSLKAGNLGLNMVAACHVIMLDPWWNPSAEDQAVDRAHRIGQTRPVTVSRLTIKDTVEDRILSLQEEKRKMVQSAFGEDGSGGYAATRLTVEDLRFLFKV